MAAIATEQRQYLTYILSHPAAQSCLELVPERGGIVTRWQVGGKEILYLDGERFANPDLSVRGGIPILFPICGNLPDNTYTHAGSAYHLKQHGFARDLPWRVSAQSQDNPLSLTLTLNSSDRTRAVYPFDFQLDFTYVLKQNSLEIRQRYTNRSSSPMPFSAGFHPYFQVFEKSQLQFDIPSKLGQDQRTKAVSPFAGQFDFEQDEIDVAFLNLTSQLASVTDAHRKLHLQLKYSPAFSTLVFWTLKGKEFYCLEPWTAPRNALNSGDHLLLLDPLSSTDLVFSLTVSDL